MTAERRREFIEPETLVASRTLANGGGTFHASTHLPFEPAKGFAVAMARGTVASVDIVDPSALALTGRLVAEEFEAAFYGTWVADGRIHVDPVQYVTDLERALALARQREQEAIYAFETGEVIGIEY